VAGENQDPDRGGLPMAIDRSMHILIVDDYQSMRRMLADILKAVGFRNVAYADDGAVAWKKLNEAEKPFGLVLLDWNMPDVSGMELLMRIRKSEHLKDLPVLMVTAEAEEQQVVEAIAQGVTNYIVKPYTRRSTTRYPRSSASPCSPFRPGAGSP